MDASTTRKAQEADIDRPPFLDLVAVTFFAFFAFLHTPFLHKSHPHTFAIVLAMQHSDPLDILIQDKATLTVASRILHDAVFSADSWFHDEENKSLRLRLWREVPGVYKRKKIFWCINCKTFQRAACELVVHHVNQVVVNVRDRLKCYSLFDIRYFCDRNLLIFETEGAISIEASITNLECRLSDIGETSWERHGYSFLENR